ncbi:unnamed protein product [Coffea canephora]|uniref:Amino acid transporter transmembrane domain-containing protein n=1 Tax=Coffea canephora TaxID=49390 RepID=A0A068VBX0_COFCA|nr:unnamed protein product [Coffea canephora]
MGFKKDKASSFSYVLNVPREDTPLVVERRFCGARYCLWMRWVTVLGVTVVALLVPNFADFLSLVGSSVCIVLGFVLPALFHLIVHKEELGWQGFGSGCGNCRAGFSKCYLRNMDFLDRHYGSQGLRNKAESGPVCRIFFLIFKILPCLVHLFLVLSSFSFLVLLLCGRVCLALVTISAHSEESPIATRGKWQEEVCAFQNHGGYVIKGPNLLLVAGRSNGKISSGHLIPK